MAEVEVGKVTHFFNKANVAGIKLSGQLSVGDTIHILGHTTRKKKMGRRMYADKYGPLFFIVPRASLFVVVTTITTGHF